MVVWKGDTRYNHKKFSIIQTGLTMMLIINYINIKDIRCYSELWNDK